MDSNQFDSQPNEVDQNEVDHWTPESSWCADCWHWVVDCEHLVDPLDAEHHAVDDACIASLAYDRSAQCLEVRYRWKTIYQFHPVTLDDVRRIWKTRPMSTALDEVVKSRHVRFDEVRSEEKLLMSLLRGWQLLSRKDNEGYGHQSKNESDRDPAL